MRILIDARMMGPGLTRGIGRYIEELVAAMLEIAPEHSYILITRQSEHRFAAHSSVQTVVANVPWYSVAEQLKMSEVYRKIEHDVLHIPHWNVPVPYACPYVITIHDLLLRHVPDSAKASTRGALVRWIKRIGYRIALARAIQHATTILVPTEFVKQDVATLYPSSASKIVVTGEGMPRSWSSDHVAVNTDDALRSMLNAQYYLLYVGAAYPHKGLQDLIDAWPRISEQYPELHLKIAGEKDLFMQGVDKLAADRKLKNLSFIGRVTDQQLTQLYQEALGFVYPTHFEGFGLPPLEAIAHGCPVLSSDAGPLPEVLGKDGAIFFRQGDPNAILAAVQTLMNDPANAREKTLAQRTILSARHDWKKAAALTLRAYGDTRVHSPAWHEGS